MNNQTPDDDLYDENEISKSQIKRDMIALQELGLKVMSLNKQQLDTLPLSDVILLAVEEWKRLSQHEAKRRHTQYVGKLMRNTDYEAIQHALDLLDPSSEAHSQLYQQIERWRDRMMANTSEGMADFLALYPDTNRQLLRQLAKNAEKETADKPDTWVARKKLFQLIRTTMTG